MNSYNMAPAVCECIPIGVLLATFALMFLLGVLFEKAGKR